MKFKGGSKNFVESELRYICQHCPSNLKAILMVHPLNQRIGWKRKETRKYFRLGMKKFKKVIHEDFAKDATINNLNLDKNSKIFDIGTGLGAMVILLALNGFDVLTGEPEVNPERDEWENHISIETFKGKFVNYEKL